MPWVAAVYVGVFVPWAHLRCPLKEALVLGSDQSWAPSPVPSHACTVASNNGSLHTGLLS